MADRIIQSLVYKLIADEADLLKSLKNSEKRLNALGDSFISTGKKLTLGLTVPIVAMGTAMVLAATEAEKTTKLLENAIEAAGNTGKVSADNLKEYASQLQLVSKYDDEATVSAFTLLEQMTALNEEGLKALMPSIQNLASALDMDLQSAASLVGKTIGSDTNALGRYGIEVDAGASKSEKMAQVLRGLAKYQGAAAAEAKSFAGQAAILKNQIGDLAEEFGMQLLPILTEAVKGVSGIVKQFSGMSDAQKRAILATMAITAAIGPMLVAVGGAIKAFATFKLIMTAASGPAGWITMAVAAFVLLGVEIAKSVKAHQEYERALKGTSTKPIEQQIASLNGQMKILEESYARAEEGYKQAMGRMGKASRVNVDMAKNELDAAKKQLKVLEDKLEAEKKADDLKGGTTIPLIEDETDAVKKYKAAMDAARSAIENNTPEIIKLQAQIAELEAFKTTSTADENTRLRAIAALRKQLFQIQKKDEDEIEAERIKRREADIQYNEELKRLGREAADKGFEEREKEKADKEKALQDTFAAAKQYISIAKAVSDAMQTSVEDGWDEMTTSILDSVSTMAAASGDIMTAGITSTISGVIDIIGDWIDYEKNLQLDFADTVNNVNISILDNKLKLLDTELKATLATIDAEEKAALEAAGFREKTEVETLQEQLAAETDETAKAELEKQIQKASIQEEYQRKRDEANAAAEKQRRQLEHDRAIWERDIELAKIAIAEEKAIADLGWFNQDKKTEVRSLYSNLKTSVNSIPIPALAQGGQFYVPPGFANDTFAMPAAMLSSGERVTVETPAQQMESGGVHIHIGTFVGDDSSYRELGRKLNSLGGIEKMRRG